MLVSPETSGESDNRDFDDDEYSSFSINAGQESKCASSIVNSQNESKSDNMLLDNLLCFICNRRDVPDLSHVILCHFTVEAIESSVTTMLSILETCESVKPELKAQLTRLAMEGDVEFKLDSLIKFLAEVDYGRRCNALFVCADLKQMPNLNCQHPALIDRLLKEVSELKTLIRTQGISGTGESSSAFVDSPECAELDDHGDSCSDHGGVTDPDHNAHGASFTSGSSDSSDHHHNMPDLKGEDQYAGGDDHSEVNSVGPPSGSRRRKCGRSKLDETLEKLSKLNRSEPSAKSAAQQQPQPTIFPSPSNLMAMLDPWTMAAWNRHPMASVAMEYFQQQQKFAAAMQARHVQQVPQTHLVNSSACPVPTPSPAPQLTAEPSSPADRAPSNCTSEDQAETDSMSMNDASNFAMNFYHNNALRGGNDWMSAGSNTPEDLSIHTTDGKNHFSNTLELVSLKASDSLPPVEKPFVCHVDGCGKRFANKFLLKKHEFIHTGKRPHQCPYCQKCFNRKDNLLRHTKTHKNNFILDRRRSTVFGVPPAPGEQQLIDELNLPTQAPLSLPSSDSPLDPANAAAWFAALAPSIPASCV